MQLQYNNLRLFSIQPIYWHKSSYNGRYSKIFLVYIANDYKENSYIVNSPYNELKYVTNAIKMQGYADICLELPYLELKSIKQLEKQTKIIECHELEKLLSSDWNIIFN